jgi:hypothetical protein
VLDGDHVRQRHGDGEVGAPGQLRRQPPLLPRLVSDAVGSGEGSDSAEHDRDEGGQTRAGAAVDAAKRRDRDMAVGPGAIELRGEPLEPLAGEVVVGERPRVADPGEDLRAVALGQQIADIALFVTLMATSP